MREELRDEILQELRAETSALKQAADERFSLLEEAHSTNGERLDGFKTTIEGAVLERLEEAVVGNFLVIRSKNPVLKRGSL